MVCWIDRGTRSQGWSLHQCSPGTDNDILHTKLLTQVPVSDDATSAQEFFESVPLDTAEDSSLHMRGLNTDFHQSADVMHDSW